MANYRKKQRNQNSTPDIEYRINDEIGAPQMRVIDNDGKMLGVMTRRAALDLAAEKVMDLVEINPKATPVVVKMVDYNKFKYQLTKASVKQKVKEEKALRASVRVSQSDLAVKANQASGFLEKGHKVKLQVQMRGREKRIQRWHRKSWDCFCRCSLQSIYWTQRQSSPEIVCLHF